MHLRATQKEILNYRGGRLAISAVPGSGKTFILSLLASELLANSCLNLAAGQQVMIVTYMNAGVETFRANMALRLVERDLLPMGFEVRTLHSLALDILRNMRGGTSLSEESLIVADEVERSGFIELAVSGWIDANEACWNELTKGLNPRDRVGWRDKLAEVSRDFIQAAKNYQYDPADIAALSVSLDMARNWNNPEISPPGTEEKEVLDPCYSLSSVLAGIYDRYQSALNRQLALDFDDLVWEAAKNLRENHDLRRVLSERYPFVLEDEAQDSIPLQEDLLDLLTGESGNWVRVGDPNQAITSTFTASHPKNFKRFIEKDDVETLPLPHSGRNSPLILGAANRLVNWVCDDHPVEEVRQEAFRRQMILPAPEGDAQPNPLDSESDIVIKVYRHREKHELPDVARLASIYASKYPDRTLAILVPTNYLGHQLASILDGVQVEYDNLLRGGSRIKDVARVLSALLSLLADPLDKNALVESYSALVDFDHPSTRHSNMDRSKIEAILRSVHKPEKFLFAERYDGFEESLPEGVADEEEIEHLYDFASYLHRLYGFRVLPLDDLILSLAESIFTKNGEQQESYRNVELGLSYQLAEAARTWCDIHPDWRLPEITVQLAQFASGRHRLPMYQRQDQGFKPRSGRITLSTQHGAKGMEWDAVFVMGIDGDWIPNDLHAHFRGVDETSGSDLSAEAIAEMLLTMEGDAGVLHGRSATETAHIELIGERLRLLYVAVTRARKFLYISRSQLISRFQEDIETEPSVALGVIRQYVRQKRHQGTEI